MSVTNEYHYYDNSAYELAKVITFENGVRQETIVNRSIFGPIPRSKLIEIIRDEYNQHEGNWLNRITNILRAHHFYTTRIVSSSGREIGLKVSGYITSKTFAWNAFKTTCYLGVGAAIFFTPSIISSRLFKGSKSISKEGSDKKLTFSEFIKSHTTYSSQAWWRMMNSDITNSAIVDGLIGVGAGISIVWTGYKLYSQLMQTVGPRGFKEWKESKKIFVDIEKTVPEKFHGDIFFKQYICSISSAPIRVPCMIQGDPRFLYEEAWLIAWIMTCINQGRRPTNPLTNLEIDLDDIAIDRNLSDQIELRILFLEAREKFPQIIDYN